MLDETAAFTELLGEHILTGVDMDTKDVPGDWHVGDKANVVRFVLDGITWEAVEKPEDDYRSSMEVLQRSEIIVKNIFEPCRVIGVMHPDDSYEKHSYVDLIDAKTQKVVLSVGTANTDDYYLWFVGKFDPTAMAVNQQKA